MYQLQPNLDEIIFNIEYSDPKVTSNETITIEIDGDSKVFSEYGIGNDNTNFASLSTQKTLTLKTTTEKPFIVPATIEQVSMTSAIDVSNSSINVIILID